MFKLDLKPDSYRFVSWEEAQTWMSLFTISPSVGIAPVLELLLLSIGAVLLIGAIEMIPRRGTMETFVDS